MKHGNIDHMKDALNSRRGKGIELTIGIGGPAQDQEGGTQEGGSGRKGSNDLNSSLSREPNEIPASKDIASNKDVKNTDLAPPPQSEGDRQAPKISGNDLNAPHPDGVIAAQHRYEPGDVPTNDDAKAHFSENLSENDIRDMANRKPRSLAERARQYAFKK